MSLAQTFTAKSVDTVITKAWADAVAARIRAVAMPLRIFLFGSAAEGRFREGSDLDMLLVFADVEALHAARAAIRKSGPLCAHCLVDLVFVSEKHFRLRQDLGGICFIAAHDGVEL